MIYSEICENCGSSFSVEMTHQKDNQGIYCPSCGDYVEIYEDYYDDEDLID